MNKKYRKITMIAVMAFTVVLAFSACTQAPKAAPTAEVTAEQMTFTLDELATFDGQDGNPAYIAIEGTVYDVSKVPQWVMGMHNGFSAGNDLTQEMQSAPHGFSKLKSLPAIGTLTK